MISNKADVLRDGVQTEIPIEDVVPGDMVRLSAGDMIPADIRFVFTKDAFVAQGSLTGESNPVEKYADIRSDREDALTDLQNIGFMGTNMVSGSAPASSLPQTTKPILAPWRNPCPETGQKTALNGALILSAAF